MRTVVAPFGAITVYRAVQAVERAVAAVRAAWIEAQTRRALGQLSPEQLADIGLADRSRSADIAGAARAMAERARA